MKPETGPMKFGGDWRGVFIRGDNALAYAKTLEPLLTVLSEDPAFNRIVISELRGLLELLASADERRPVSNLDHLRPFVACLPCTSCYKGHYEDPSHYFICTCLCHEEDQYGRPMVP